MKANRRNLIGIVIRSLARTLIVGVFLLWGAFFVEHTQEWFIAPFPRHPPLKVCIGHVLHLLMLIGLLASLRWPRIGLVWVAIAAFAFFIDKAGSRFLVFFGMTLLPILFLWLGDWLNHRVSQVGNIQTSAS